MDERINHIKEYMKSSIPNNPNVNELFGMFNDGKLSSDDFIKQKSVEKKWENIFAYEESLPSKYKFTEKDIVDEIITNRR